MKRLFALCLCLVLLNGFNVFAINCNYPEASDWAKPEIRKAAIVLQENHMMLTNFQKPVNRYEFCDFAYGVYARLTEKDGYKKPEMPETLPPYFQDALPIAYPNVAQLQALGFVNGVDGKHFQPGREITREEAATIIHRIFTAVGYEIEPINLADMVDCDSVAPWAKEAMSAFLGCEPFGGVYKIGFAEPKNFITREELIVMNLRFCESIMGKQEFLLYEDTTPEILAELGLVARNKLNSDEKITVYDVFEAISRVMKIKPLSAEGVKSFYEIENMERNTHFDDEKEPLILALCQSIGRTVIKTEELEQLDVEKNITYFEALLYLDRMLLDTYSCQVDPLSITPYDIDAAYRIAKYKDLIDDADTSRAKIEITRKEFYQLLHKAMFSEYVNGAWTWTNNRYIDRHLDVDEKEKR